MKKTNLKERKIVQAANYIARAIGLKVFAISHLSEKLSGDRSLALADLDALQQAVPAELLSYWCNALCYPARVEVLSIPVADAARPSVGHPVPSATLYLPPDPPAACGALKEAA